MLTWFWSEKALLWWLKKIDSKMTFVKKYKIDKRIFRNWVKCNVAWVQPLISDSFISYINQKTTEIPVSGSNLKPIFKTFGCFAKLHFLTMGFGGPQEIIENPTNSGKQTSRICQANHFLIACCIKNIHWSMIMTHNLSNEWIRFLI